MTTEKLTKIRARCVELLVIAEKRTPGKWEASPNYLIGGWWVQDPVTKINEGDTADCCKEQDALFIASCAGAAEAGWRSTIGAIDWVLHELQHGWNGEEEPDHHFGPQIRQLADAILAAWPEELL